MGGTNHLGKHCVSIASSNTYNFCYLRQDSCLYSLLYFNRHKGSTQSAIARYTRLSLVNARLPRSASLAISYHRWTTSVPLSDLRTILLFVFTLTISTADFL